MAKPERRSEMPERQGAVPERPMAWAATPTSTSAGEKLRARTHVRASEHKQEKPEWQTGETGPEGQTGEPYVWLASGGVYQVSAAATASSPEEAERLVEERRATALVRLARREQAWRERRWTVWAWSCDHGGVVVLQARARGWLARAKALAGRRGAGGVKRAGGQLCECEADIGGGRAAGSGIGMRGGLGRSARAREAMSAEGARARLQQAAREWLARRGGERELVRCSAELGMPGWLRASEQELRRVLQAEAAAAAEAKATAAEAKAVAEVKARAAAEAEAAKAVTEAAARVANFFAEAKAAEDKAAAEAEAEALAAATAEARALVEAEAEAEAMARATAEAVDAMKAAATAERRERRGLPRAMRGQSGVGEAGGAAQAELRFAVSMAAEAEKQARRLTAQAREAQAILESLEAVARGRYPLRARVEADGRRQGGDRAEHRGRVRKGGSAAAFGGVSQVEEEWRDHRAQDPGREGSVGGAGQAGRCRCQPVGWCAGRFKSLGKCWARGSRG